jgi:glycine cleavage system H lipoate-binding protein
MASGRVNSIESIKTASEVIAAFRGRWTDVEKAAVRDESGVYVIRRSLLPSNSRR